MTDVERLIYTARLFLGMEEEPDGSTLFGQMYDLRENRVNEYRKADWCMMGIEWCARAAGIPVEKIPHTASCPTLLRDGQRKFKICDKPEIGDICIFKLVSTDIASHVGIVTAVNDDRTEFLTLEFNRKHTTGTCLPWVAEDRVTKSDDPIVVGFYHWAD